MSGYIKTKVYWVNVGLRYRAKLDKLTRPTWLPGWVITINQIVEGHSSQSPPALWLVPNRVLRQTPLLLWH